MKTTLKEFTAKAELRKTLNLSSNALNEAGNWQLSEECKNEAKKIDSEFFDKVDSVNVSFMIGYRLYYRKVSVVGKAYFDGTTKMTKSNGYRAIEEIKEITDKMKDDMISDSYYY